MTLGQKIRQARIERGLTQKELVGEHITRNMLSKIENDSATPSVRTLEYLASKLALPAGYFLTGTSLSDGTSPDGLDNMRTAYREGRYLDCIQLLELSTECGTTDEGYLLHARAALGAAREALQAGNTQMAKEYADNADYYNKEGLYYSPEIDAEMSLILAECALSLDLSEFEANAKQFECAVRNISFSTRYSLAKAEYLLKTGEIELAERTVNSIHSPEGELKAVQRYIQGCICLQKGDLSSAVQLLQEAESSFQNSPSLKLNIYQALEQCYRELENFKMAYHYAAIQRDTQEK